MQLFQVIQNPLLVKTAAAKYKLSDNPETTQSEILAQLYKQHPYLGQYVVNLELKSENAERGTLLAVFSVLPPSAQPIAASMPVGTAPNNDTMEADALSASDPNAVARIPVIVRDKFLEPFDVFMDVSGEFFPLTEPRLSKVAYSANMLGIATRQQQQQAATGDANGMNNFDTQLRGFNMRSEGFLNNPNVTKLSEVSLMSHVGANREDLAAFIETVTADRWLSQAARIPLVQVAFEKVASLRPAAPVISLKPAKGVAVLKRCGTMAKLKTAAGGEAVFTAEDMSKLAHDSTTVWDKLCEDNVLLTETDSFITDVPVVNDREINESCICRLSGLDGTTKLAAVVAAPLDIAGSRLNEDKLVITDESAFITRTVHGEFVAPLRDSTTKLAALAVPAVHASGYGFFILPSGDVTAPVNVERTVTRPTGDNTFVLANELMVKEACLAPVEKAVTVGSTALLPRGSQFVPVRSIEPAYTFHAKTASVSATVLHAEQDGSFFFTGAGAELLGLGQVKIASLEDCLLALGCMGASDASAKIKIAEALQFGEAQFSAVIRELAPERDVNFTVADIADIRQDTIKVATTMLAAANPDSVDALLSLNFITPENVLRAVDATPMYEQALSSLCRLLINVRLGLREVPEDACLSAIKGLTRAVDGLKRLQVLSTQN